MNVRTVNCTYRECTKYVTFSYIWFVVSEDNVYPLKRSSLIFLSEVCVAVKTLKMCKEKARKQRVDEEIILYTYTVRTRKLLNRKTTFRHNLWLLNVLHISETAIVECKPPNFT